MSLRDDLIEPEIRTIEDFQSDSARSLMLETGITIDDLFVRRQQFQNLAGMEHIETMAGRG
ncbi:hypothetical protein CMO88_04025 [Candidatus Woesearchaeota archaeon]|jgi:hypothetical protein|nr:hypothetical protein [Candidatus Woesearchaeota archaeon]|tara:strand:- start:33960 stop:34142 length:183 start_codon:yes stop_codon:yes gene_type:complete